MSFFFDTPFPSNNAEDQIRHAPADAQATLLYAGQLPWQARARVADAKLRAAFATTGPFPDATNALRRLVCGRETAGLATIDPVFADMGPQAGNTGIDAFLQIALLSPLWRQAPESWRLPTPLSPNNRRAALGALARFLFCEYLVPAFFDRAWLGGFDPLAHTFRQVFVHLGRGGKLEAVPFPIPMSHRAAHFFLQAPPDFSIAAALRWGQIKALNGSDDLAYAVRDTFLQNAQTDEVFWLTFVRFLVAHPEIPLWHIGPLADYVRYRKFGGEQSDGDETREGLEPNFSMKGRAPNALLQSVREWHALLARSSKKRMDSWPASRTICPFDRTQPDNGTPLMCRWHVRELTRSTELFEEGQAMRNCVRTYQAACEKGKTSLWSLRVTLFDAADTDPCRPPVSRRLLTIEINNSRRAIVQVRGKCNYYLPTLRAKHKRMADARDILCEWAAHERLQIACSV